MQVLLVSATPFEIAPAISWLEQGFEQKENHTFVKGDLEVRVNVTGVGMLATTWHLANRFAHQKPDLVINAGIAGTFDPAFKLGDVVFVSTERLADLGVEDVSGHFIDLYELGFVDKNTFPFSDGMLRHPNAELARFLPTAQGITVNKAHGSAASIAAIQKKYPDAQVESMEGAAIFYACLQAGVSFAEIRAISNRVEPRNRGKWDLPGAVLALNEVLIQMLTYLI